MRALSELIEGVLLLSNEALDATPEQLDGASQLLAGVSTALGGLAKLKATGNGAGSLNISPSTPTPDTDSAEGFRQTAPADAGPAVFDGDGPAVVQLHGFKVPPDAVQCEEATQQRQDANRIDTLRGDPIIFLEKVEYYVEQLAAAVGRDVEMNDADKPADLTKLALVTVPHTLSLECLPGTRPLLGSPDDFDRAVATWDRIYTRTKELHEREILDLEDRDLVFFKIADKPDVKELL